MDAVSNRWSSGVLMPVLRYTPFPTAEPTVQGLPTQSVEGVSPLAFGAGIGAGLEKLGGAFGDAGDRLANIAIQRQQQFNQIASDEQINNWQDAANKVMY